MSTRSAARALRKLQPASYARTVLSSPHARRGYATIAQGKEAVRIVEVGPRYGLQNEKSVIPVETKVELINRLARAGSKIIEAGSYVSPKWVPQACFIYLHDISMLIVLLDGRNGGNHGED